MTAKRQQRPLQISECWLFAIDSKVDLARRLSTEGFKITVADLDRMSADAGNFKLFSIRQGNKDRPVQEPKRDLQKIHSRIHELLARVQVPDYLHSAVKGKSYLTNARAHDLEAPTIKIDIKKFFPSVPRRAIFRFCEQTLRCRRDVAGILADLLTFNARLATGSSASPILAYYAFKSMFDALAELAENHGLKMTCYVDDITMSGAKAGRSILYKTHQIISKYGLKSHKMKAFPSNTPKIITGVCNAPAGERVPNKLHFKIKVGFNQLRNARTDKEEGKILGSLLGRLEAARQIDPAFGARAKTLRAQNKAASIRFCAPI
jgi:RNA-directed DNA polymerase